MTHLGQIKISMTWRFNVWFFLREKNISSRWVCLWCITPSVVFGWVLYSNLAFRNVACVCFGYQRKISPGFGHGWTCTQRAWRCAESGRGMLLQTAAWVQEGPSGSWPLAQAGPGSVAPHRQHDWPLSSDSNRQRCTSVVEIMPVIENTP